MNCKLLLFLLSALPALASVGGPRSTRTNEAVTLVSTGSSCSWTEVDVPSAGSFGSAGACTTTYTPGSTRGDYELQVTADGSPTTYHLGVVTATADGVITGLDPDIEWITGRLIHPEQNPFPWFANRAYAITDYQISLEDTNYPAYWEGDAYPSCTVAMNDGSFTATFSGCNAQTVFCGGGTSPASGTNVLYIRVESPVYPGTTMYGRHPVIACPTSSTVTVEKPWQETGTNNSGMEFTVEDSAGPEVHYIYSPIPGNYYDGCLAYYQMHFATGIEAYRTAAREKCRRFWTGPQWMNGFANDILGGASGWFMTAGPARGQALLGLALWSIEDPSAPDIWPGVATYPEWLGTSSLTITASGGNAGDVREAAYQIAFLAACAKFSTVMGASEDCEGWLEDWIDYLEDHQSVAGYFPTMAFLSNNGEVNIGNAAGTQHVTVTDGSANVTITGSTLSSGDFDQKSIGFYRNPTTNYSMVGDSNASVGIETNAYSLGSWTDSTHFTLSAPYDSGDASCSMGCTRGMLLQFRVGFGAQPFMHGLFVGGMGYAHAWFVEAGNTTYAATSAQMIADVTDWLATDGVDTNEGGMFQGRGYVNCEPDPNLNGFCTAFGAVSQTGEGMRGFAVDWEVNANATNLDAWVNAYRAQWCPYSTTLPGFTSAECPGTNPIWMVDIAPPGTNCAACGFDGMGYSSYMIDSQYTASKWLGFFFGMGGGINAPVSETQSAIPMPRITGRLVYNGSIVMK